MDFLKDLPEEQRTQIEQALNTYKSEAQKAQEEKDRISQNKQQILDEYKKHKDQFSGVDIEEYKKLKSQIENDKYKEVFDQYGIEGIEKAIAERESEKYKGVLQEKETKYSELEKQLQEVKGQYEQTRIANDIAEAMGKVEGIMPKASTPLKYLVQENFIRDEDGRLVVKDKRIGNDGKPMGLSEWLGKKETMKEHPYLYQGNSGAGVNGGEGSGEGTKMSPQEFEAAYAKVPANEKMAWLDQMEKEGRI